MKQKLLRSCGALITIVSVMFIQGESHRAHAATCGFIGVAGLSFGAYDVYGSFLDSAGNLTFSCSGVAPSDALTIALSAGSAPSYTPRQMLSGADRLNYNIYIDAARVIVWGDGTGGTSLYGPVLPPEGIPVSVPIYGRIPANQDVPVGVYADTIVVTMSF